MRGAQIGMECECCKSQADGLQVVKVLGRLVGLTPAGNSAQDAPMRMTICWQGKADCQ